MWLDCDIQDHRNGDRAGCVIPLYAELGVDAVYGWLLYPCTILLFFR